MNTAFLHFEHQLIDAGFTPKQVDIQLKIISEIVNSTLASKSDIDLLKEEMKHNTLTLKQEIRLSINDMKLWILTSAIGSVGTILSVMSILHYLNK